MRVGSTETRAAGKSAAEHFDTLAKAWRRRALRPLLLVCLTLVLACAAAGTLVGGDAKFWLGMLAAAPMTAYLAIRDTPPKHIENWRLGSEGERKTAKVLRPLAREGWSVFHDKMAGHGTNLDHVLVSEAGVFLLDSKNFEGEATCQNGDLQVRWLEDPDDGWTCRGIPARMRGTSAELKERLEAATGIRVWVQPVVVLWMRFPERVAESSGVLFVQGGALTDWLRERPCLRHIDTATLSRAIATMPRR